MTLGDLRSLLLLFMNVNASQANDDVTTPNYNTIINNAYRAVWLRLRGQVSRASILCSTDLTFPAGSQTMTLPVSPVNLQQAIIYDIWQLDGSGNPLIQFNAFFETRNVLRLPTILWAAGGYSIRVYYLPAVELLTNDNQEPILIPPEHHEVIVWEALRIIKMVTDKEIPDTWEKKIEEIEHIMVKELSTRPVAFRGNVVLASNPMARPMAASTL